MNTENYERRRFETEYECDVPTFGHPVGNDGWVRCKSKTFPGKYYFFNVDSRSRTWGRPLASCVPVPIVNSGNLPRDEYFWDQAPLEVSDIEDDDEEEASVKKNIDTKPPIMGAKEAKRRNIFAEVLFKLYHCYGDDYCNGGDIVNFPTSANAPLICKSEIAEDLNSSDESPSIQPEICYSSSSDGESCEFSPYEKRHRLYLSRSARASLPKRRTNGKNGIPLWRGRPIWPEVPNYLRIGKLKQSPTVDPIERQVVNFWTSRNVPFSNHNDKQTFASIGLDSEDADEEADEEVEAEEIKKEIKMEDIRDNSRGEQYRSFLPRLKAIEFSDLVTDPTRPKTPKIKVPPKRKAPKPRATNEKSTGDPPPKKVTKIICEMNGIRTINYDFLDPELPPGVRAANLSDSGSSSTEMAFNNWLGQRRIEGKDQNGFVLKDEFMDIKELCLSDSETSSSSSSSDGATTIKHSNSADSESDSSESSSSSSSGSSSMTHTTQAPTGSMVDIVKKEEPDSEESCKKVAPRASNGSIVINPLALNLNRKEKVKSESSGSSRSSDNGDCSWIRSDSQTDDDE